MFTLDDDKLFFVIDTDKYSGNFERQLCAYMTGELDESDVGQEYACTYRAEMGLKEEPTESDDEKDLLFDLVGFCNGDEGFQFRATICPTPGYSNNGSGEHTKLEPGEMMKWPAYQSVAIVLSEEPSPEQITLLKNRAEAFAALSRAGKTKYIEAFNISGFRIISTHTSINSRVV